jgi:hypothetical protein
VVRQVLRMESQVLTTLSFDVTAATPYTFATRFLRFVRADDATRHLTMARRRQPHHLLPAQACQAHPLTAGWGWRLVVDGPMLVLDRPVPLRLWVPQFFAIRDCRLGAGAGTAHAAPLVPRTTTAAQAYTYTHTCTHRALSLIPCVCLRWLCGVRVCRCLVWSSFWGMHCRTFWKTVFHSCTRSVAEPHLLSACARADMAPCPAGACVRVRSTCGRLTGVWRCGRQLFQAAPTQSVLALYHRYSAPALSAVARLQLRGTDVEPLSDDAER